MTNRPNPSNAAAHAGPVPAGSKRQALLDAALTCFLEHGVVETTVDQLLHRSGASVGSLYHHFGGKEQLADALYVECLGRYHDGAMGRLEAAMTVEGSVRAIVEHHLDWTGDHGDRARFLLAYRDHEIRPASDELRGLNKHFYGSLERWLADRLATGACPPLPAVVAQWVGPSHNYARHWLTGQVRATPADVKPFLSDSAWHALRPILAG